MSEDGQLRAVHLILDFEPLLDAFQDIADAIKAGDPRLQRIDVSVPGFLARRDLPPVKLPFHRSLPEAAAPREETTSSRLSLEWGIDQSDSRKKKSSKEEDLMSLNPRKGLRDLMAGRNKGSSSKEIPKSQDPTNLPPPPSPPITTLDLLLIPNLKKKRKEQELEEGAMVPQKGAKQQKIAKDKRASSVESREDPSGAEVFVAEEWVKDARNETRAEAHSRVEAKKSLGALKQEQLELAAKLTAEERARRSAKAILPPSEASKGSGQAGDQGQGAEVAKDKGKGKKVKPPLEAKDATKVKDVAEAKDTAVKAKEAEARSKEADPKATNAPAPQPSKKEDPSPPTKA
ncbi:MAP7 domain-containing protein 1-like [Quercus lobata]|uniref:MAP7 domain-containing protein 1-like n=1 Tax=Quercus lobata TaxID=97700 RepID=UPI0012473C13|nr:MAP7 domain-containing protein 1-like [Quercus lobata]